MKSLVQLHFYTFLACSLVLTLALSSNGSPLIALFGSMNFISFCYMGLDKRAARSGAFRVPEAFILLLAILGAGFGIIIGGYLFRHKTRKRQFITPVIAITTMYLLAFILLARHWEIPVLLSGPYDPSSFSERIDCAA